MLSDKSIYDLFHISVLVMINTLLIPSSILGFAGLLLISGHCAFASRFLIECEDEKSFKTEVYFFLSYATLSCAWLVTIGALIVKAFGVVPYGI